MLARLGFSLLFGVSLWGAAWAQGAAEFDGEYAGKLTLKQTISGDCAQPPPGSVYPLIVAKGQVRFSYIPRFVTTLTGRVDKDGRFEASARTRHGVVKMTGRIQGGRVTASILSPSCNYTFQTAK